MRKVRLKYPIPRMASVQDLAALALAGVENRHWYSQAQDQIELAAPELGVSPKRVADLLALFSPRVSVLRSAKWTITYIREAKYLPDVTRGHKAAVEHYNLTGEIRGPKTYPFARALMGDLDAVVLDTWMGIALSCPPDRFEVRAVWEVAANRLRAAAAYLGWRVAEAQAAIWAGTILKQPYGHVPTFNLVDLL